MSDFARRHYVAIARIIAAQRSVEHPEWEPAIDGIMDDLCHFFAADNGRFDRDRFERACRDVR